MLNTRGPVPRLKLFVRKLSLAGFQEFIVSGQRVFQLMQMIVGKRAEI